MILNRILYIFIFLALIITANSFALTNKNTVYVYHDAGVSEESFLQTMHSLKSELTANYYIVPINAQTVIKNNWTKNAALFVMPGGADLPYMEKLKNIGNKNISNYVKNGGAYLGICAGSYYGASYVEFDKNGKLEVIGKRELAFFPGKAIGPVLAPYDYKSNSGVRAATQYLQFNPMKKTVVYYNGGGYFENANHYSNVTVLANYANHLPSIIYIPYEKGRVILSGVHVEYDAALLDKHDVYLKKIIPQLKKYSVSRKIFFKEMLRKLGIVM